MIGGGAIFDFDQTLRIGAWSPQYHGECGSTWIRPNRYDTARTWRWRLAAHKESFAAKAMMGRIGEPEDIANAVVFFASPDLAGSRHRF